MANQWKSLSDVPRGHRDKDGGLSQAPDCWGNYLIGQTTETE